MSSSTNVIHVEHLTKAYRIYQKPSDRLKDALFARGARLIRQPYRSFAKEFFALRNVSFQIVRGETIGVIGRNGSGKSTLLELLCGTLTPTAGTVSVKGRIAALLELGAGFNPEFTGRENVFLNAAVLGMRRDEVGERLDSILAFADIGDFIDQPVKVYSSGMYVRLAFSVAIHVDPQILIIDEALAVGDFAFQFKCLAKLAEFARAGVTVLFVTHDIAQVQKLCSRVIYLKNGGVAAIGDPKAVCDRYFSDVSGTEGISEATGCGASSAGELSPAEYDQFARSVAGFRRGTQSHGAFRSVRVNGRSGGEIQIDWGDELVIDCVVELSQASRQLVAAFYVINDAGQLLVGSSTRNEGLDLGNWTVGAKYRISSRFPCRLRPGAYGVQVFLAEEFGLGETRYVDQIDLAARFSVAEPTDGGRWALYSPVVRMLALPESEWS